jgi:hypothetical protein
VRTRCHTCGKKEKNKIEDMNRKKERKNFKTDVWDLANDDAVKT